MDAFPQRDMQTAGDVITLLKDVNSKPQAVSFTNNIEINNNGGRLQGIQKTVFNGRDFFLMTGSSDSYSYLVVADKREGRIGKVVKLLDKPFKHAGGFQINNGLMAVGIEDNGGRKESKVYVWKVDDPLKLTAEPLKVIERRGEYERATSGCTAITLIDGYVLVAVGDWNTEHLDFYRLRKEDMMKIGENFEKVFSITTSETDRSDWTDDKWGAYQNINFLQDGQGKLFLAGMSLENGRNVVDLFEVISNDLTSFRLKKVYTKEFEKSDKVNFDRGAGVYFTYPDEMEIIACPAHITDMTEIYLF